MDSQRIERIPQEPDFQFMATGIGSVPYRDIQATCNFILRHLPHMPFWPQCVKRSHLEDMSIQFSEGLPLLRIEKDKRRLVISGENRESELVDFYEHFLAEDMAYFAISKDYAPGLHALIDLISGSRETHGPYIKGQTVGPVTFIAGIMDRDGRSILHSVELREAMVKGIAIKTLWQAQELRKTGKRPIIFLDEPYLSGFGSAFSPIQRQDVVAMIKEVIVYVRERSHALIGIHCCGNTDWSMLLESEPDIINFDAFGYMRYFLLYPEEIMTFLKNHGVIAWGAVPTTDLKGDETAESLFFRLEDGLNRLQEWGLDLQWIGRQSILTPSCGMGCLNEASAEQVFHLLSSLSKRCHEP